MINLEKQNVVLKFRKFWNNLDTDEQDGLWNILTALRGCDINTESDKSFTLKFLTSARIRGLLFGDNSIIGHNIGFVNQKKLINVEIEEMDRLLKIKKVCSYHFLNHYTCALMVFRKLGFLKKDEY